MKNNRFLTLIQMQKLLAIASGATLASQLFIMQAFAALPTDGTEIPGLSTEEDIKSAIVFIIGKILDFILILAILYVVIAGIRLIVSGGDDTQKDKAKNTIIYVIAGIFVVLFARVIVLFVNTAFGN